MVIFHGKMLVYQRVYQKDCFWLRKWHKSSPWASQPRHKHQRYKLGMWWTALWDHFSGLTWPVWDTTRGEAMGFPFGTSSTNGLEFRGFSWDFRWCSLIFHIDVYKLTRLSNCWIFWRPVFKIFCEPSTWCLGQGPTQRVSVQRATTGLPPTYHEFFFQDIT